MMQKFVLVVKMTIDVYRKLLIIKTRTKRESNRTLKRIQVSAWASANIFSRGESRHFAYSFQVTDAAVQMDVHKTIYSFYTTQGIPMLRQQSQKCCSLVAMLLFTHTSFHTV